MSNSGSQIPNENNSTISMIVGTTALVLFLPAAVIALFELLDQIEYGDFKWIGYSIISSLTIISILLISGFYLVRLINSENIKRILGIYLIALSGINFLLRYREINDSFYRDDGWGGGISWFEFMQMPRIHEQLELAFLGILIGALIMKK